jgi:DsbC/DsbD-like thiol-disulfide interchange protein
MTIVGSAFGLPATFLPTSPAKAKATGQGRSPGEALVLHLMLHSERNDSPKRADCRGDENRSVASNRPIVVTSRSFFCGGFLKMQISQHVGLAAASVLLIMSFVSSQSLPKDVVTVKTAISQDRTRPGDRLEMAIILDIAEGYHINSHEPSEEFLIPTRVTIEAPPTLQVGSAKYPRPELRSYPFAPDKRLSVYEKRAVVKLPLRVKPTTAPGAYTLKAKIRYQPCSEKVCYPPTTRELEIALPVVPRHQPVKRIHPEIFGSAAPPPSSR